MAAITLDFQVANYVEAGVWGVIGIACLLPAVKVVWSRRQRWLAFGTFIAFGLSDIVEAHTGAWWRPAWLLGWKAVCIATALGLIVAAVRNRKKKEIS